MLKRGSDYAISDGPCFWSLCESLKYSQQSRKHSIIFTAVEMIEGQKRTHSFSMDVTVLRAKDVASLEVEGVGSENGGLPDSTFCFRLSYNPDKRVGHVWIEIM